MLIKIMFEVDGMPPRKDGGHSMWNKDKEVNKLIELRRQFLYALHNQKIETPLTDYIGLKIDI